MKITKLRKPIGEKEYKLLMNAVRGDLEIKDFNRTRFLRIFSLLYFSGMRINEISQISVKHIKEIFKTGETTIISHKTKSERILYFSENAIQELKKYFLIDVLSDQELTITSWGKPKATLHVIALIALSNAYIQKVLGNQYSSHSFRIGIITEMAVKQINPKIIQSFVGHRNINTTMGYIRPCAADIKQALVR